MPEIQKYNLREKMQEADEKYMGDPAVAGMSAMTHYRYNNSTRTQMYNSHLNQFNNIRNPSFPFMFTGAENVVGRNSTGYEKSKSNYTVVKKIVKFEKYVGEKPFIYQLFVFDEDKKMYHVFTRKELHDLGQDYGFQYNNTFIDSLQPGDKIGADDVIYKSTSYDDSMNYCFGADLDVIYSYDPYASEDAAIIDDYAAEVLSTVHSKKIRWGWNDNDFPLNIYGDENNYLSLPWIGQIIDGYVASSRPHVKEQEGFDFKSENTRRILDGDRTIEYFGEAMVIDYDFYINNDNIPDNSFNHQLLELIDAQNKYWEEIQETCLWIMGTGEDYSHDVDLLYRDSIRFLNQNPKEKWNNGKSVFNNIEICIWLANYNPLSEGGKFTSRYGNKSVVSQVRRNWEMPFTASGRRAHVILNLPAITNRTTGNVIHEMDSTWILTQNRQRIAEAETMEEKEYIFFELIREFNATQLESVQATYARLTPEERKEYMESVVRDGIFIHQDSLPNDDPESDMFYKLRSIHEKNPWLQPETMYVYKYGQIYPMGQKFCMGSLYFLALKQNDLRGFSARSTGAVNMKGLPERSYKNKKNESAFSDTAIRFGEYENMTFLIGLEAEELACTHAMYRTSLDAVGDLTKAQFMKKGLGKFKKFYKSRAAEIFYVIYKSLGNELTFKNPDTRLDTIDDTVIKAHEYDGKTYLCTDMEMYEREAYDKIRSRVLDKYTLLSGPELEKKIEEEFARTPFIMGRGKHKKSDFK